MCCILITCCFLLMDLVDSYQEDNSKFDTILTRTSKSLSSGTSKPVMTNEW